MSDLTFYNDNPPEAKSNEPVTPPAAIPLHSTVAQTQQATPKAAAGSYTSPIPSSVTPPTGGSYSSTTSSPVAPSYNNSPSSATPSASSSYTSPPSSPATPSYGSIPYGGSTRENPTSSYSTGNGFPSPYPQSTAYSSYAADKYPAYSTASGAYAPPGYPPKKKKEKRRFGLGQMFLVALVSALSCGIISAAAVFTLMPAAETLLSDGSGGTTTVKTVNVSEDSDSLVSAVAEKAAPSVVGVRVTTTTNNGFFGPSDSVGEGSGVIYSADGYIITNCHVIASAISRNNGFAQGLNASTIEVFLPSDAETAIESKLVGYDETADLAVLKIEKTGLPAIELGNSDDIKVGDIAVAIGNPGGLEFMGSVSSGIISGLNRSLQTDGGIEMNLIQTDAAINPGNSGGALVNKVGKLIGINNSKITGNGFEGMGFAIPVNEVAEIIQQLIKNEGQPQSYLGITIDSNYDADTLERMGYPAGAVVYSVAMGSPAADAGIQAYDIITKVNGKEITSYPQLNSEKNKYAVGETITLTIYREERTFDVRVTLGAMQGQLQ